MTESFDVRNRERVRFLEVIMKAFLLIQAEKCVFKEKNLPSLKSNLSIERIFCLVNDYYSRKEFLLRYIDTK